MVGLRDTLFVVLARMTNGVSLDATLREPWSNNAGLSMLVRAGQNLLFLGASVRLESLTYFEAVIPFCRHCCESAHPAEPTCGIRRHVLSIIGPAPSRAPAAPLLSYWSHSDPC